MKYKLNGAFDGIEIINKAPRVIEMGEGRRYIKIVAVDSSDDVRVGQSDPTAGKALVIYQEERLVKTQSLFRNEKWDRYFSNIEIGPIAKREAYNEVKVVAYLEKVKEGRCYLIDATKSLETNGVRFPGDVKKVLDSLLMALKK